MLQGIPSVLSPELLKTLMEMGHGDEIVLADGNFPSHTMGKRVIRADGLGVPALLDAVLRLMPLDTYVATPVALMRVVPGDPVETPIWDVYREIIEKHAPKTKIEFLQRYAFYERAQKCFAAVQTGESALYANILLKKGVVV